MADPTPIPAEALEAAAKVAFRRYESEYTAAPNMTWRDFVPEVRELLEVAAPALLAAGRTAAAAEVVVHADANPDDTSAAYWKARDLAEDIPGYAHSYGVSFDGDTLWLECDSCETPVHGIDAGDSLEVIVTKARDHERVCGAAHVAENGADHV